MVIVRAAHTVMQTSNGMDVTDIRSDLLVCLETVRVAFGLEGGARGVYTMDNKGQPPPNLPLRQLVSWLCCMPNRVKP